MVAKILLQGRYDYVYDRMPLAVQGMSLDKRMNLLRSGGNILHQRLSPWSMPLHMHMELTNYCNLNCPVCPTGAQTLTRKLQAMDIGLFEQLMAEVGPYLLTMSLWAWGEPLLHPRLREILQIAARYPVHTLLSTNGQVLNQEKVIDAIAAFPPSHLIVAIDGLTDETNSVYRTDAKLAPILEGVKRLAEIKEQSRQRFPILHMRYIVMGHNEHELEHIVDFARDHKFDFLSIRSLIVIDAPEQAHRALIPQSAEWRAYHYFGEERIRPGDFVCQQPFWFPTVLADGTIVGCEQDYNAQEPMGRMAGSTRFSDIWQSERAVQVRKIIRDSARSLTFCRNCPYSGLESSHCSIQAVALNSSMPLPTNLPAR